MNAASNAVVLIQKQKKAISIVTLKPGASGLLRPNLTTELCKVVVKIPDSSGPSCDLAIQSDEGTGLVRQLFITHNTGLIEKVVFDYNEA